MIACPRSAAVGLLSRPEPSATTAVHRSLTGHLTARLVHHEEGPGFESGNGSSDGSDASKATGAEKSAGAAAADFFRLAGPCRRKSPSFRVESAVGAGEKTFVERRCSAVELRGSEGRVFCGAPAIVGVAVR